jgi:protein-S-isoprenylcysteine O-methyltransferase Ste14
MKLIKAMLYTAIALVILGAVLLAAPLLSVIAVVGVLFLIVYLILNDEDEQSNRNE